MGIKPYTDWTPLRENIEGILEGIYSHAMDSAGGPDRHGVSIKLK